MSQEYDEQRASEPENLPREEDNFSDLPMVIQVLYLSTYLFLNSPVVAGTVGQAFPDNFIFPAHSSEVISVLLASAVVARKYRIETDMTIKNHINIWLQWIAVVSWIAGAKKPIQSFLAQSWQGIVQQYELVADITDSVYETGEWLAERPALLITLTASLVLLRKVINHYNDSVRDLSPRERYQYNLQHLVLLVVHLYELSEVIIEGGKRFVVGDSNKRNKSDNDQV